MTGLINKKPDEEEVKIYYMEDPKKIFDGSEDKKDIKGYKFEDGLIKIAGYQKRLSDSLNDNDLFLEYENNVGDLVTINKNAILFLLLNGNKEQESIKYESSQLEIELKRGLKFKGFINTQGKLSYRQALEKRWFIPFDAAGNGVFKTVLINKFNIMRVIEHKEKV